MKVPWAGKHGRFTLMFESFAIFVLQNAANIEAACELLKIHWSTADAIMKRAVDRGLDRRKDDPVEYLGIDEKSFRSGHRYVSLLNDIERQLEHHITGNYSAGYRHATS